MKVLSLLLFFFAACSPTSELQTKNFSYVIDGRSDITMKVPTGYKAERVRVGDNRALEQFYVYPYGSVFYISNNASWNSLNHESLEGATPVALKDRNQTIYNGVDKNGFYWKEVRVDSLRVGYANVPVNLLNRFEEAVQSVYIKKSRVKLK